MTDKYRCINPFAAGDRIYAGGTEVEDKDPILKSHGDHFAKVTGSATVFEATTAAPGEQRDLTPPRKAAVKKAAPKRAPGKSTDDGKTGEADDA